MNRALRYANYIIIFLFGLSLGYFFIGAQTHSEKDVTIQNLTKEITELRALPASASATANIVAVRNVDHLGSLNNMTVEIRQGKGRVLVNTNPFVEPDTQYSAETAVKVAQNITKVDLSNKDIIITFESQAKLVGGPSAGAAMTLAAIAAMEGKHVKSDVVITGTINSDGTIGQIGGVLEKGQAAGEAGLKLFLVPRGQGEVTYYEQRLVKKQIKPGLYLNYIKYIPHIINLSDFLKDYELGVLEVSNIEEAARVALED